LQRWRVRARVPWHLIVFLGPAVCIYTVFMVYPLVDTLRLSLYDNNGGFVGLQNYNTLLTSGFWAPSFLNALANNIEFFAIHMLFQNPIGLILAVLLTQRVLRGRGVYRAIIFTPTVFSIVIVGFIWKLILSPLWGITPSAMSSVGLGQFFAPWLGLQGPALIVLSLMSVWQWVGIPMLLFTAALLGISEEILEAARVDGASPWQVFWRIQLPLILPTVGIVTVLTFVGNFNAFDLVYSVQTGLAAPNYSTDLLGTYFYRTFFGINLQQPNLVMGTTVAGMMFLIIMLGVAFYFFVLQRRLQTTEP
jgi:raffinose/stachyose/melibiose transport system permease protein